MTPKYADKFRLDETTFLTLLKYPHITDLELDNLFKLVDKFPLLAKHLVERHSSHIDLTRSEGKV